MWIWFGSPNPAIMRTGFLLEGGMQLVPTTKWQYNSKNCMTMKKTVPVEGNVVVDAIKQSFKVASAGYCCFTDALQKDNKKLMVNNKQLLVIFENQIV